MSLTQTQVIILDLSNQEDILICGFCKLVFNSLELFINHKNYECVRRGSLHNGNGLQPLSHPSVSTSVSQNNNKETESSYKNISCSICKKTFKRLKCLYSHIKLHQQPSQCQVCGRCFENASHLKRHLATHKVWPDGLNETTPRSSEADLLSYSCSYCDAVLSNYSQFRAHLNSHTQLKKFKCIQDNCIGFFDIVEDLLYHVNVFHKTAKYTCHNCKKVFFSLNEIAVHHKNHCESTEEQKVNSINQYKCTQCDATFRKPEKLSLHLLTESHNKSCIHCKKAFASDKRLRMHLQIHKKSKPFQCDVCSKSFHMKKYLTTHMLKHGDRQFICIICKHSFKRQDVLRRHMRIHSQIKIFKCPYKDVNNCSKEFTRKDKLKQHLNSHAKTMKSVLCESGSTGDNTSTVDIHTLPIDSGNLKQIVNAT